MKYNQANDTTGRVAIIEFIYRETQKHKSPGTDTREYIHIII